MEDLVKIFLLVLAFVTASYCLTLPSASLPFDDWIPYKDEKCIKLIDRAGHQTKEDAEIVCRTFAEEFHLEDIPTLVNVKTEEKQEFLQKVLFTDRVTFDNVWLGLDVGSNGVFQWNDGAELLYTNWVEQNTSDQERQCVQMESGEGAYDSGKWVRVNCQKKNAVVCERTQVWSVAKLQNILLSLIIELESTKKKATENIQAAKQEADQKIKDIKQEADQKIADVKQEAGLKFLDAKQTAEQNINSLRQEVLAVRQEANRELDTLKRNPVPVGFVYVQLPGQQPPSSIWPQATWSDVSSQYAGNFFRVVGGNAAAFGQVQSGSSPRLERVMTVWDAPYVTSIQVPTDGTWSPGVITAKYVNSDNSYSLKFFHSNAEVRPQNQAVIVWKRIQ